MVMHARSGGSLEIMGLMQGYIQGPTIIVTDAFRLPVEGTETRVNAQDEANEYMVQFLQRARDAGQLENAVGWYHSHPGYGCWLSGIDVNTQMTQQMYSDPFVAVVIDPDRTISAGKVEIGAFRTFPEDYKPESSAQDDPETSGQGIPLAKANDFGAYADRYYPLQISHFKSSLDSKLIESLWNKYWVSTLSSSPLFTNHDYGTKQIEDLAAKIRKAEKTANLKEKGGGGGGGIGGGGGAAALLMDDAAAAPGGKAAKARDEQMADIVRAGNKIAAEEEAGLVAGEIKERLFGVKAATAGDAVVQG